MKKEKPTRNFDTLKKHQKNVLKNFFAGFSNVYAWLLHCSFESETQSIFNQDLENQISKNFDLFFPLKKDRTPKKSKNYSLPKNHHVYEKIVCKIWDKLDENKNRKIKKI